MKKAAIWAAALAVVVAGPVLAQEAPAALVVRLQGDVRVSHAGGEPAPAAVGEGLRNGDRVLPDAGSRAILITRTGATQVVTGETTVSTPAGGPDSDMFDRAMRTLARAATADARTSGGRQGMIRPIPGEPVLVAPRNELTLTPTRPTFRWLDGNGTAGYTLQLRKVDGGRPIRFQVGEVTEWMLPDSEEPLERGAIYAWTVAPEQGRPTREQRFRVLGREGSMELQTRLGEVRALGLDPQTDGLFLAAVVYRDLELPYEAREALAKVEATGGMDARLYLLKGDILNLLGHADEARAAFDHADEMMR